MTNIREQETLAKLQENAPTSSQSLPLNQNLSQPQENTEGVTIAPPPIEVLQKNDFPMTSPEPDVIGAMLPPAQPPLQPPPIQVPTTLEEDVNPDTSMSHDHPDAPLRRSSRSRKPVNCLTSSKLGDLMNSSITSALTTITSYFSTDD